MEERVVSEIVIQDAWNTAIVEYTCRYLREYSDPGSWAWQAHERQGRNPFAWLGWLGGSR